MEDYRRRARLSQSCLFMYAGLAEYHFQHRPDDFPFTYKLHQAVAHMASLAISNGHPSSDNDLWVERMVRCDAVRAIVCVPTVSGWRNLHRCLNGGVQTKLAAMRCCRNRCTCKAEGAIANDLTDQVARLFLQADLIQARLSGVDATQRLPAHLGITSVRALLREHGGRLPTKFLSPVPAMREPVTLQPALPDGAGGMDSTAPAADATATPAAAANNAAARSMATMSAAGIELTLPLGSHRPAVPR